MGKAGPPPTYDHDAAIALYETGEMTMAEVAAKYDVSTPGFYGMLKVKAPHLLGRRRNWRRKPTFNVDAALKMLDEGSSFRDVGAEFDVSPSTIYKHDAQRRGKTA